MKKFTIALIIFTLLIPRHSKAQSNGAVAAVAVGAGLLAIGAGIAAIEDMKERAELTATQWVLANQPEMDSFSLKTLDFNGKKTKDMSATSVISFKLQEFNPSDNPKLDGKKQILLAFTSYGWISDQGIDFNKVQWYLIDSDEWLRMMVAYAKVASKEKNENTLKEVLANGVVVNKGIKAKGKTEIPFFKLEGDMYLVADYSSEMKLVYNEKTLGIYLKKTGNLVQMGRSAIIETHEFLFSK